MLTVVSDLIERSVEQWIVAQRIMMSLTDCDDMRFHSGHGTSRISVSRSAHEETHSYGRGLPRTDSHSLHPYILQQLETVTDWNRPELAMFQSINGRHHLTKEMCSEIANGLTKKLSEDGLSAVVKIREVERSFPITPFTPFHTFSPETYIYEIIVYKDEASAEAGLILENNGELRHTTREEVWREAERLASSNED